MKINWKKCGNENLVYLGKLKSYTIKKLAHNVVGGFIPNCQNLQTT